MDLGTGAIYQRQVRVLSRHPDQLPARLRHALGWQMAVWLVESFFAIWLPRHDYPCRLVDFTSY